MARFDCAIWRPISVNTGGTLAPNRGLMLHHAVANGSLFSFFNSSAAGVSAHFWVSRDGTIEQYVDTDRVAWHAREANGTWVGVETEGCTASSNYAEPMTAEMVNALARIYAEGNRRHAWPYSLSSSVGNPGFGYHRMAVNTACPCDVRLNRRQEILDIARGQTPITPTPPPPTEEPEMAVTQVFKPRPGQLSFAQVAASSLWHKWSNNGGESWRNECLISPSGPPGAPVTAKLKNTTVAAGVEDNTMFITCEDIGDRVYVARQGTDGRWDIRSTP